MYNIFFRPLVNWITWLIWLGPSIILTMIHSITVWLFRPLDNFCLLFVAVNDQLADFWLTFIVFPTWQSSYIEAPLAVPILAANAWFDN